MTKTGVRHGNMFKVFMLIDVRLVRVDSRLVRREVSVGFRGGSLSISIEPLPRPVSGLSDETDCGLKS